MLSGFQENKDLLDLRLHVNVNFDLLTREITVGERRACYYCIDGFIKDELMEKMLQYFIGLKKEDIPQNADEMCKAYVPHVEVETEEELSVENLLQSNPDNELEDIDVENKSETRKMIEKFVDDNPESAANLLRNWLNEDWS